MEVSGIVSGLEGNRHIVCSSVKKIQSKTIQQTNFLKSFNNQSQVVARYGLVAVRLVDNKIDPTQNDVEWLLPNCFPGGDIANGGEENVNEKDDEMKGFFICLIFFKFSIVCLYLY